MRKTRSRTQAENAAKNIQGIKDMIAYFRVPDLQNLLSTFNVQHLGRKSDLQKRALNLLQSNFFNEVAEKVREIYQNSNNNSEENSSSLDIGPPEPKRMYQPQIQLPVQPDVRAAAALVGNNLVGNNLVVPFPNNMTQGYPIHPDVRLKRLAFYDVIATLLRPSTLVPSTNQRLQEAAFFFTLTPQQATEIAINRDIRAGSKVEYTIQVQLRFCLLETSCEQDDCFPPNVIVKVNNKLCQLPNPIPTNRPNVEPKRPPRPVNVTVHVKLSPTVTNSITVQWCPDFTRGYVISAYLVKKLTSQQLLGRMKTKGIKSADYTRALIKEKLTEDADCEVATTMLKVSLMCPLGKMRMAIPCRASTCSHLQCFDASLYLQMNERKPTWNCPVCDKPAVYDNLVIDGYFQEVLASPLLSGNDNEIQLHKDGSWSTHLMANDTQVLDTPIKPKQKIEVISDDLEVITTEVEQKIITKGATSTTPSLTVPANTPSTTNNEPSSTTSNETVDLTLSDSDDDDLPLRRKITSASNKNVSSSSQSTAGNSAQQRPNTYLTHKKDDNLSSSIISLDSPSPPSSPNYLNEMAAVTSTTMSVNSLSSNSLQSGSHSSSNYQINPLAINRFDNQFSSAARPMLYQKLFAEQAQAHSINNVLNLYRNSNNSSNNNNNNSSNNNSNNNNNNNNSNKSSNKNNDNNNENDSDSDYIY